MTNQNSLSARRLLPLNETPVSQHVRALMEKQKVVEAEPSRLVLSDLLKWAIENLPVDERWGARVLEAEAVAAYEALKILYENLATAGLLEATTLEDAAWTILAVVADFIPGQDYMR